MPTLCRDSHHQLQLIYRASYPAVERAALLLLLSQAKSLFTFNNLLNRYYLQLKLLISPPNVYLIYIFWFALFYVFWCAVKTFFFKYLYTIRVSILKNLGLTTFRPLIIWHPMLRKHHKIESYASTLFAYLADLFVRFWFLNQRCGFTLS